MQIVLVEALVRVCDCKPTCIDHHRLRTVCALCMHLPVPAGRKAKDLRRGLDSFSLVLPLSPNSPDKMRSSSDFPLDLLGPELEPLLFGLLACAIRRPFVCVLLCGLTAKRREGVV